MGETVKFYPAYWGGTKLAYPNVPAESPKFANSVVAGNLIFVSGCQGQNDETVTVDTDVFEDPLCKFKTVVAEFFTIGVKIKRALRFDRYVKTQLC